MRAWETSDDRSRRLIDKNNISSNQPACYFALSMTSDSSYTDHMFQRLVPVGLDRRCNFPHLTPYRGARRSRRHLTSPYQQGPKSAYARRYRTDPLDSDFLVTCPCQAVASLSGDFLIGFTPLAACRQRTSQRRETPMVMLACEYSRLPTRFAYSVLAAGGCIRRLRSCTIFTYVSIACVVNSESISPVTTAVF